MKFIIYVLLIISLAGNFTDGLAQEGIRTGFVVVTVVSGNIAGLIATEKLIQLNAAGIQQEVVAPSTVVTSASLLVNVGQLGNTGIAIANPSSGTGSVNLVLTDAGGIVVLNEIRFLGPQAQFSQFINEFFPVAPAVFTTPLLLTINSEIPVAVLALDFRNGGFSTIPVTSLASPTPVPVQSLSVTSFATAPFQTSASPGFGIGIAPLPQSPTATGFVFPTVTTTSPATTAVTIGGGSAVAFAQIAIGGGWATELALGNSSATPQVVRVDFFSSNGVATSSITDVVVPSRGVFFISSDSTSAAIRGQ